MIEVFKTNVVDTDQANRLTVQLQSTFLNYEVNFDLEDCDNILRIEHKTGPIDCTNVIRFLKLLGCIAEALPDGADLPSGS